MAATEREERITVLVEGERRVVAMDSIAHAGPQDAGQVVVTGSHGGRSAGEYARRAGVGCFVCSDAGFGKNEAGIVGLRELDADGVAGVAVAHDSARIGDGLDVWERGVVTFVNETARAQGFRVGAPLQPQVRAWVGAARERVVAEG